MALGKNFDKKFVFFGFDTLLLLHGSNHLTESLQKNVEAYCLDYNSKFYALILRGSHVKIHQDIDWSMFA